MQPRGTTLLGRISADFVVASYTSISQRSNARQPGAA